MNRKFQNTTSALLATAGVMVLGLTFALPPPPQPQPRTVTIPLDLGVIQVQITKTLPAANNAKEQAQIDTLIRSIEQRAEKVDGVAGAIGLAAETATAIALAGAFDVAEASEPAKAHSYRPARKASHSSRHLLAMPYFSFAPRG